MSLGKQAIGENEPRADGVGLKIRKMKAVEYVVPFRLNKSCHIFGVQLREMLLNVLIACSTGQNLNDRCVEH